MSEQWIVTGEDQNGEYGVWSVDGKKCLISATSRHLATTTAQYANETNAEELATLKAQRDELLAERDKLLFHESQLVESLKSYINKYGPGYSCTDTLAYDNATGVLAAIANAEKDKP